MAPPSESFVEALTEEEICPLCLDGYAPVDEVVCAVCEAPACPGCVEQFDDVCVQELRDATEAPPATECVQPTVTRCFACRPALVPPPLPRAAHDVLPPPLPLPHQARGPRSRPLPVFRDDSAEPDEGGLMVFPVWRKAPLLALARAADAVHLDRLSSLLVGWAYTGGKRFALAARVSRVSREWTRAVRARGAGLRRLALSSGLRGAALAQALKMRALVLAARTAELSRSSGLRLRGAALPRALKVRALMLAARTAELSRRLPRAARAAWPGARVGR